MPSAMTEFGADPWSAVVFLFHDHAWEPLLIERALSQPAFFIGAMASRRTHTARLDTLRGRGVPQEALERIVSPLGLTPSARDPATLALSAFASRRRLPTRHDIVTRPDPANSDTRAGQNQSSFVTEFNDFPLI